MAEFVTPGFLQGKSPDNFHEIMRSVIPADIDLSEGGFAWDMTWPTALVAAKICEFVLPEVVKLIIPEYSYGEFLDEHAKGRGLDRRAATYATGVLHIEGEIGTVIQAGSLFSTAAVNDEPSVDYKVLTSVKMSDTTVTVPVQCTQAGTIGNAPANTIILVSSKITGIKSVNNPGAMVGGTDEETDESLIERILSYDRSQGNSFVGSVADYKRWAQEVDGVGSATVIPANSTSGLVRIIITDATGAAATGELCNAVYNHIMSPDDPEARLAPINANLTVVAPATVGIGITATVELEEGATIEAVQTAYMTALAAYLPEAMEDGEIKYSRVYAALSAVEGVNDFTNLRIGLAGSGISTYGTANVIITSYELPTIEKLSLTAGTV